MENFKIRTRYEWASNSFYIISKYINKKELPNLVCRKSRFCIVRFNLKPKISGPNVYKKQVGPEYVRLMTAFCKHSSKAD